MTDTEMEQSAADATTSMSRPPSKRRQREAARKGQQWRKQKWAALEALRNLRAEELDSTLRSPSLTGALLYRPPSLEDIPPLPRGRRPQEDDMSDRAAAWRNQLASREAALAWRARYRQAYTRGRGSTWRRETTGAERGGLHPGSQAYPAAWDAYLTRRDVEGPLGAGWMGSLGRAFRRIERDWANTPLLRALWAYTEPYTRADADAKRVHNDLNATGQDRAAAERNARQAHIQRVMAALGVKQRAAYLWVDAAAARLVAELEADTYRHTQADALRRKAEEAEAHAWQTT